MSLKQDLYYIGVVDQFLNWDDEEPTINKAINLDPNTKIVISDQHESYVDEVRTWQWRETKLVKFDETYFSVDGPNTFVPIFTDSSDWSRAKALRHFLKMGKYLPFKLSATGSEQSVPSELKQQVKEYSYQMLDKAREFCKQNENVMLNGEVRHR